MENDGAYLPPSLQATVGWVQWTRLADFERQLMLSQGNEIGGGTPADFAALVKAEAAKWGSVVKRADIKPE